MMTWATSTDALAHWPDATVIAEAQLEELLQAAYVQVYGYAPRLSSRVITSCATTEGSNIVVSPDGGFIALDVGRSVSGDGVPTSTVVDAVADEFTAVISANATTTGTADLTISGVPTNFILAHIFQAREIYSAAKRDEQDVIGIGDYAIRARPLTAAVKQLLRPRQGTPVIG